MHLPDASLRVVEAARERGLDIDIHLFGADEQGLNLLNKG